MYKTFGYQSIEYQTFKNLLVDLNAPATEFERHLTCVLLDSAKKRCINIRSFEFSLNDHYRAHLLVENKKKLVSELVELDIYIRLNVVNYSYVEAIRFRGHFRVLVTSDMYVGKLIDMIQARVPMIHRDCEFYNSLSKAAIVEHAISHYLTFQEAGYAGGPYHEPTEKFIFYIQLVKHPSCSLLLYKPHETQKHEGNRIIRQDNRFKRWMVK